MQISIENEKKFVWGIPGQKLIDFYLDFIWKWKDINLGHRSTELKFEMDVNIITYVSNIGV